jgi:hypothetical protein
MTITKEQMLHRLEIIRNECRGDDFECGACKWDAECDEIEALVESSGEKESNENKEAGVVGKAPTGGADKATSASAPSPAPTIKKDLTVGPSVEEAMETVKMALDGLDPFFPLDVEAAFSVLKAALRPKVVSGEWVDDLSARIDKIQFVTCPNDATLDTVERTIDELGIVVEEKP